MAWWNMRGCWQIAAASVLVTMVGTAASDDAQITRLLAEAEPPQGVVFEIVEGDEDALERILPALRVDIRRLRERFPGLDIAVVSHGAEQFGLERRYRDELPGLHAAAEQLVREDGVDLHVCETHAGWYGVTAADFPDYVDVAPAGPVQISNYEALGYELIRLRAPD